MVKSEVMPTLCI